MVEKDPPPYGAAPEIAVVIPTRNRETRLAFALEALSEQTLDESRFEVVVVRDEDAPEPFATAPSSLRVRFLTRSGSAGPTAKRNFGWRSSDAPLIAFTDDDCRPRADWLEQLLAAAREHPGAVLQGRTVPDPDEMHLLHGLARSRNVEGPTDWYEASNITYPRSLLQRVGGFDEDFYFGSEDTDLGLRARASGAARVYVGDAVVSHAVLGRTLRGALADASAWESAPLVIARHPEQRRAIFARLFMKPTHALLPLALLGVAGARRRPIALALAAPYIANYVDPERLGPRYAARLALHLPARACVDAAEIVATVRAAARHRVMVV